MFIYGLIVIVVAQWLCKPRVGVRFSFGPPRVKYNMTQYLGTCGAVRNFFTEEELSNAVKIFKKLNSNFGIYENKFYGISQQHQAYLWFRKTFMNRIAAKFDPDMKLIFGVLLDCYTPLGIHVDLKDIPDPQGTHYLSFLIPYSVYNQTELCNAASTLIFDELSDGTNNVRGIEKLSHLPAEEADRYSLRQDLIWNCGDLLWWSSELYHASSDFLKIGHQSKQGIVIHTYVV